MSCSRALIQTHHMTSRTKISAIHTLTKSLDCRVVLKTGQCPGIMIAECAGGSLQLSEWIKGVKALRYKDYRLQKVQDGMMVRDGCLRVADGEVMELDDMKAFGELMGNWGVRDWWREGMGWGKKENG